MVIRILDNERNEEMRVILDNFDNKKTKTKEQLETIKPLIQKRHIQNQPKDYKYSRYFCPNCNLRFCYKVNRGYFKNISLNLELFFCSLSCKLEWIYNKAKESESNER